MARLTREEIKELIPESSVKVAFLRRSDIKDLSTEEQERRWSEHLEKIQPFMDFLTLTDSIVLGEKG